MNREWMYRRFTDDGYISHEFQEGLESFIEFARGQPAFMDRDKIRCSCKKCKNKAFMDEDTIRLHLASKGFELNYHVWVFQGERPPNVRSQRPNLAGSISGYRQYHQMVVDAAGTRFNLDYHMDDNMENMEEPPNPEAQRFYDMLRAADNELWPGCRNHSQLSLVARMMNLKAENSISEKCFDQIAELMKEIVPDDNRVPENFYRTKRLLSGMGLPVQKIDCCYHNCMLYWKECSDLAQCSICSYPRYETRGRKRTAKKRMYYFPLTHRLQRLYTSNATAKDMRWHASTVDDGVMRHPADSPAWKHLNATFPAFALETRNVRLGLSTDGFQPFGQTGKQYSSWPIVLTPYNLPPWMCMKEQYMFLTVLVPGPQNPKEKLDVFLQPLIEELCHLWDVGVTTYDVSQKQNFTMRAALLWTISDFPAYSMLSGWSTAGRLACPHCREETDAFTLSSSGKQSWFDNHRQFLDADHVFRRNKRAFLKNKMVTKEPPEKKTGVQILNEIESLGLKKVTEQNDNASISKAAGCGWKKKSIFWDLPYWSSLLIRHNLDVMHIEKNVFDNLFNTILNVKGKTKDTVKSRNELNQYCYRPELRGNEQTGKFPKACYTLDKKQITVLFEWVKEVKFPDGYVSNMSRCVDMKKMKLFGMKSHDCHVFMQRIVPIAFRELLPANVWKAITELSIFFRDLCSRNLSVEDACRLNTNIPIILCQLERFFPPSWFDSIEHLPVHLADEARLAGPVQYRWMYPFERYLGKLKKMIGNKARVEGSICNAYLVQEASTFCSFYFEDHVNTRHRNVPCNFSADTSEHIEHPDMLSIFKHPVRPFGVAAERWLTDVEYKAIQVYALMNCTEVEQYIEIFVDELKSSHSNLTLADIDKRLNTDFPNWFTNYACNPLNNLTRVMRDFSKGPARCVRTYPACFVNGYKFHTTTYGSHRATMNSGVCIKGTTYSSDESDYFGRLLEVLEVEYPGSPIKKTMFFKCEWFDGSSAGTHMHPLYKIVSVNHRKRYAGDDAFVLASQAIQVFYCSYPSLNKSKADWWAVCKTQARATIHVPSQTSSSIIPPPLQEDDLVLVDQIVIEDEQPNLADGVVIEIEEDDEEEDDEDIELSDGYMSSDDEDVMN